ncbi:MAG: hypothetical protein QN120_15500 [Armatimonadota bacterium]|nr:hypothetical protein [Armatimonadota bacterium]MDR7545644.1 hypothetical protein [Armatimonadota bacterium]
MGILLGGLSRDQDVGVVQSVVVCLGITFGLLWASALTVASRVGSEHLLDFVLWSLFSQTAFTALVDGPLMLVAAILAAARLPPLLSP